MNFGQALEALKEGKLVARKGWNGKGMFLAYKQGHPVNAFLQPSHPDEPIVGESNLQPGQMLSFIVMKTAGVSSYWGEGYADYVPWLASQTDILAEDWELVS